MEYKNNGDFRVCQWRTDIYTETGADYSLPDYNGDVRKILFTEASVRPSGSFENGDNIGFSGIIVYNLIYFDSENRVNSVSFTSDYDLSVKCDSDNYISSFIDTSVSNYSLRLLGPRKISAKATLSSRVAIEKSETPRISGSAFECEKAPESQVISVDMATASASENVEREYAEELLRLEGIGADDIEIIYSNAECVIDSVTPEENGVGLKGNMRISALVRCEGEAMQTAEKSIRIDESIPFSQAVGAMKISPRVSVSSVRCSVNADETGCSVIANVIADLGAESYDNECVSLVTDAYRCDANTENEYGEYKFYELSTVVCEKEDFSSAADREGIDIENLREVICLGAVAKITGTETLEGVTHISGEIHYSGIASGVDEKGSLSYYPFKHMEEFEKDVNINCQNDQKIKIISSINCTDVSAVLDENKIYLTCRAQIRLVALLERCETVLTSSEIIAGEECVETGAKITVYYPEEGESIFNIAKKFRTTVEKITADNSASLAVSTDGDMAKKSKKLVIF